MFKKEKKEEQTSKSFFVLHKGMGKFYNAYGIDAHILNYLFNYKVIDDKKAGFPDNALVKVQERLEEEKISYQIVFTDKDPYVKDYGKISKYPKICKAVNEKLSINNRLDFIIEKIKNCNQEEALEIIQRIEECIK